MTASRGPIPTRPTAGGGSPRTSCGATWPSTPSATRRGSRSSWTGCWRRCPEARSRRAQGHNRRFGGHADAPGEPVPGARADVEVAIAALVAAQDVIEREGEERHPLEEAELSA